MPRTTEPYVHDDSTRFPVEDIVQNPLPGYVAPSSVSFSPDDKLISYLFSPDSTLSRKIFVYDPTLHRQQMVISPPGGGVDEGNLSVAEKLRRERLRERGTGITRYDWAGGEDNPCLVVPLPGGVCCSKLVPLERDRESEMDEDEDEVKLYKHPCLANMILGINSHYNAIWTIV